MFFTRLALVAAVGKTVAQSSIFVAPQQQVAFGISIPNDPLRNDVYFSLAASSDLKWAGIGLGSSKMEGALYLIIYSSASGANVTLSTRTTSGEVEPTYDSRIEVETLAGTGIANGTMSFLGRCANCRRWPGGGSIDITSSRQDCIFAFASGSQIKSDDPTAPLNYHTTYGSFSIDFKQAISSNANTFPPSVANSKSSSGANLLSNNSTQDWVTIIHAVVMIACFAGLLPLGIIFLRVSKQVRWHAVNQFLALVGIVVGAGIGVYDSFRYNRSKRFNTAHQVLGLLVSIFMFVQLLLGFFHHRIYQKTHQTTKLAPIHVWLGRIIIVAAIIVAFLGFPLALSIHGDVIFAIVILIVAFITATLFFWKSYSQRQQRFSLSEETGTTRGFYLRRKKNKPSLHNANSLPLQPYRITKDLP